MVKKLFFFVICLLIPITCCSCRKKHQVKQKDIATIRTLDIVSRYDIPIMFRAQNITQDMGADNSSMVSYKTGSSYLETVKFYKEEMERLGWNQTASFDGALRLVASYNKPHRTVFIIISKKEYAVKVVICFIQQPDIINNLL